MLSSVVSSSAGIISATSTISAPQLGILGVATLIVLLCLKEILSASELWSEKLACSINTSILPLLIAFFAIVAYQVVRII